MQVISVEGLKSQLYQYNINNLSIFSDACRSFPDAIQQENIETTQVLGRGRRPATTIKVDRYNASRDGRNAYMLPSDGISPPRCIFSSVLFEGINGHHAAFDVINPDSVSAHSLETFANNRMEEIGVLYRLDCQADIMVASTPQKVVFHERDLATSIALPQPQWPDPLAINSQAVLLSGKKVVTLQNASIFQDNVMCLMARVFDHFESDYTIDGYFRRPNLIVLGEIPLRVWALGDSERISESNSYSMFNVDIKKDDVSQVLIEFTDGFVASAVVYKELFTVLIKSEDGISGWFCIKYFEDFIPWRGQAIKAIWDLQMGELDAREVDDLAAKLRSGKHDNPVLGAISSYLYDYTGDIDSIRRMAYFYCKNRQPIPFDIALMGHLIVTPGKYKIRSIANVPAVPARELTDVMEQLPKWVSQATGETRGLVAGWWPWLRQGWQFIAGQSDENSLCDVSLKRIIPHLLPSQYSSFNKVGAKLLIEKFHLRANS
ncbi:MAG: hypothetical protein E7D70_14115 [Citrobacter freundii]|nr:hypothetical protein [Citrobacter sp.]MDU2296836.1 hypothetical protein [Citrobacter freundii]MDU3248493.1 hypothetical protein [Citrobacter freundii]MDU7734771.1 hypothetical protein [Citrobacter freundii]MDU7742772.1 hypothetical protein [Citrobacter sp.]MDU7941427.1 hypothetical protein [Citrobacter freundii]